MKTPEQVLHDVGRRLTRCWAAAVTAEMRADAALTGPALTPATWNAQFPLGQPTGAELTSDYVAYFAQVRHWRSWAAEQHLELRTRARRVHGTDQELPTHVLVPDLDTAARLAGGDWLARLRRARARARTLADRYPHLRDPARTLAAVDGLTDLDFDLLCKAADWFAVNDATGLTPRQVPVAGLHAKWLNTRQSLVRELAARDDLGLLPRHPARIHFTYLDPAYRATGGRLHDSATVGDPAALPYQPRVLVISENKDTALHFPPLPGGIAIEGVGRGAGTIASFNWVTAATRVVYWGDMDADGLEILNEFRAAGISATSILMDLASYQQWEQFGTSTDAQGRPLGPRTARPVPHLTRDELALYHLVIGPACPTHRRIEQERIPLDVALQFTVAAAGVADVETAARKAGPGAD